MGATLFKTYGPKMTMFGHFDELLLVIDHPTQTIVH